MSDLIHLQVDTKTSRREALEQASNIMAGLSDILFSLGEGTALTGDGYFSLAQLIDLAKAFVDAATPEPWEEGQE